MAAGGNAPISTSRFLRHTCITTCIDGSDNSAMPAARPATILPASLPGFLFALPDTVATQSDHHLLADDLPPKIANKIRDQVGDSIFASVIVEPDHPDESTDRHSDLLFPPTVQPPNR
jgi:hypothetical protein